MKPKLTISWLGEIEYLFAVLVCCLNLNDAEWITAIKEITMEHNKKDGKWDEVRVSLSLAEDLAKEPSLHSSFKQQQSGGHPDLEGTSFQGLLQRRVLRHIIV